MYGLEQVFDVLSFCYIVPHQPSEPSDASLFQLISPGIMETAGAFKLASTLPQGASDLVMDSDDIAATRMLGQSITVVPIQLPDLKIALEVFRLRLTVVLSMTRSIAEAATEVIKAVGFPILHVTPDAPEIDRASLRKYCLDVASVWETIESHKEYARTLKTSLTDWKDPLVVKTLPFKDKNHMVTLPNIAALTSVGLVPLPWDGKGLVATTNEPYFDAIQESIEPIIALRRDIIANRPGIVPRSHTDLILTAPAVLKSWFERNNESLPIDKDTERLVRNVLRQIAGRETYCFQLPDNVGVRNFVGSRIVQGLLSHYTDDVEVYTAALALRAASCFAPVIRLPTGVNNARSELQQLASARRRYDDSKIHKLNRLAQNLSNRLSRGIPDWIIQHLRTSKRIKLVSDAPLEWMNVDGLPLMLRADVSRIPITPGNLFVAESILFSERYLPASAFQKALVIRSFKDNDPLRTLLESAVKFMAASTDQFPDVRFVDVKNRQDIVQALTDFDGAILIYDGHGTHSEDSDVGALALVDEKVDSWFLREHAKIPPIVLLSACDTHPLDASHATVANGFLNAGAMTVLGTAVPVRGTESATLVARLLLRVGMLVPAMLKARPWKSFRWSEVLPGMQRRQFVTEAMHRLADVGSIRISDHEMIDTAMEVGLAIDGGKDWIGVLLSRLSVITGRSADDAKDILLRHASFVDALTYVQLGNPELVVGIDDDLSSFKNIKQMDESVR